jgi:hypothetical protein
MSVGKGSEGVTQLALARRPGPDEMADLELRPLNGVVTLSEIDTIWTINQQAKPLKTLVSKLAVVSEFH